MVLKKYTFRQVFDHEEGWRRETELLEGDYDTLRADVMMEKLAGTLGGYQLYDYDHIHDYINANHLDWESHQSHEVEQWFDKGAMVKYY